MKILKYFLVVVILLLILLIVDVVICYIMTISPGFTPPIVDFKSSTFVERSFEDMDEEPLFDVLVVKKYAEEGDNTAQYIYGYYLFSGRGIPQDKEMGVEWIRKAADHDNPFAQGALAYLYFKGDGVPQDKKEARKWAEKAEKNGFPIWEWWARWEQEEAEAKNKLEDESENQIEDDTENENQE
ncbi:MAG: sel1 repeat family protein [Thermoguttaceae bacterium]|nr:sel1 repeat family protein [Thermoguttaceae bacterium]